MQYFISRLPNKDGNYEIHHKKCFRNHLTMHHIYLGEFDNCEDAIKKAKKHFSNVVFCPICLQFCNKKEPIMFPNKELFEDHILTTKK